MDSKFSYRLRCLVATVVYAKGNYSLHGRYGLWKIVNIRRLVYVFTNWYVVAKLHVYYHDQHELVCYFETSSSSTLLVLDPLQRG